MKLQTLRRGTAAAAVLTMSLTFAACGSEDDGDDNASENTDTSSDTGSTDTETETPEETTPAEEPAGEFDVFGPACGQLPQGTEDGSLESMVQDTVATAAGTNPLLKTLVAAVGAAGLGGVLDSAPADPGLTVFAPADDAFKALGDDMVNGLVTEAQESDDPTTSPLATVLSHHVLPSSLTADAIVGEQTTLIGDNLTIEGDAESGMTVSDGEVTANVLCGNIPTANATVYVIDSVLTNAKPA